MDADSADVIVLGGGGAGLAAAAEAASLGCSVILLEKNPRLGGTTALAIGSVSASGTRHQRAAGIADSPDEHFEDLGLLAGPLAARDNLVLRRMLVDQVADTFAWLQAAGCVFMGPALEPPQRHPRMHNVVPNASAFPYHLGRRCRRLGVDVRLSTRANALVVDRGRVVGLVAAEAGRSERQVRARRGVVLATGDYSASRELKTRYASAAGMCSSAVNEDNAGDGHLMALDLGASILNGDIANGPSIRFVPPPAPPWIARIPPFTMVGKAAAFAMARAPKSLLRPVLMSFVTTALGADPGLFRAGAVLVDAQGRRFTDECDQPALALAAVDGGTGYIVMDASVARKFSAWPHFVSTAPNVAYAYLPDYKRNRRDVYHEAPDAVALAHLLGMDAPTLAASLRSGGVAGALAQPPLVALGPVKSYVVHTDGGLKVSERLEVLGAGDKPIGGLFAAGSAGQGGLLLFGHGHHLAWAFVSGRLAGRQAARSPKT